MTAPSFTSFPPSFTSFPDVTSGPSKLDSDILLQGKGKEKRNKDKKKERHERRNDDGQYKKYKATDNDAHLRFYRGQSQTDITDEEDIWRRPSYAEEERKLFYSDRQGDELNIRYGGLHAGDVPKYHIVGGGKQVLGLSRIWIATRRSGKGVLVGLRDRKKTARITDWRARALLTTPPTQRLEPGMSGKYEEIDGFIRLPSRRGPHAPEESYRSITGFKEKEKEDSGVESSSESDGVDQNNDNESDSEEFHLTSLQTTFKNLEEALAVNSRAVDVWLSLLSHTLSTIPITSKNATRARAEITLSIISRALNGHPDNSSSTQLRLKYIKAGEEIWHESKIRAEWEDILKIGEVEIWMEWLEWRMSNKGVDEVIEGALRAMNSFGTDEVDEIAKLRVFWRVAVALQNAGFTEWANAMFQAQGEMTFGIPGEFRDIPFQSQISELEEFWDSEMPRMGDEGATGWATWVKNGKPGYISISSSSKNVNVGSPVDLDPYRQWAGRESQTDRTSALPLRSMDNSPDPYATVLFSDIRALLQRISSDRAKTAFRLAWLSFLGLHLPGFSLSLSAVGQQNWDDRWNAGYLTKPTFINAIFPDDGNKTYLHTDAVAGVVVGRTKIYANSFGPIKKWGFNVIGIFDDSTPHTEKKGLISGIWSKRDVDDVDSALVKRIFKQLRDPGDDEWNCLELAFDAATNVRSALKASKLLLSQARDSLIYWAAHAKLEWMRGHPDGARKVYQTVLIASRSSGTATIWYNWAEIEWLSGRHEETLNVVLLSSGITPSRSGMTILRAKRNLEELCHALTDTTQWKDREAWMKLRALLEFLLGHEGENVLELFDAELQRLDVTSVPHESLTVASLFMLYHFSYTLKNPMPPSILRERAQKALHQYPSNSVILGIFLEGEKGQGIWGRIRGMLGESDGKSKDVARRIEEVWIAGWEKSRWSSEIERTRNGLITAVEHERTRGSPIIWRIFIEFEIRTGELQRAKKNLFRAIGECPLVKELYLLAFGPLRSVFQGHELSALADTMAERGLRLRKGLDEALDGWKMAVDADSINESEDSGDEIVHNAHELRRLMPY